VLTAFPSAAYRAIGRIQVRDRGLGRTEAQLRRKLIAAASELGADAVVLDRSSTRRSVGSLLEPFVLYDDLLVSGVAIVRQPLGSTHSR
jgi:Holliday junction resolvasome RuvABC ATP-dependent DNA helicase subunit